MWLGRPFKNRTFLTIKHTFFVLFSDHYSKTRPFDNWTHLDHLNTRLVRYSDEYCNCKFGFCWPRWIIFKRDFVWYAKILIFQNCQEITSIVENYLQLLYVNTRMSCTLEKSNKLKIHWFCKSFFKSLSVNIYWKKYRLLEDKSAGLG